LPGVTSGILEVTAMAESVEAYVRAALQLQGYDFDEARIAKIVAQFARIDATVQSLLRAPLDERAAAAPAFRP
jgi:Protein of unknown function (DUF4089)